MLGQPNLNFEVDRDQAARFGINVSDVQDAIQTAVGGNALNQVLIGEQRYDLVLRYLPAISRHQGGDRENSLACACGERVSLAQLTKVSETDGGLGDLSRSEFALRGRQVQCARQRFGQHGRGSHQKSECRGEIAGWLHDRLGRRIREPEAFATPAG